MRLIRLFFLCVFGLSSVFAFAQDIEQDVYRAEIGLSGGSTYYLGEANSVLFSNLKPVLGGFARYKFNPRLAVRGELLYAFWGVGINEKKVWAGDVCGEFNFFELERNKYKRYSKLFSPYIFTGISLFTGVYKGQKLPEFGIPFGIGIKLKLKNRWNLDLKWTNRLLLADNLEGSDPKVPDQFNNPNKLNGTNIFNNDLMSTITFGISYDIWKKECDCRNTKH